MAAEFTIDKPLRVPIEDPEEARSYATALLSHPNHDASQWIGTEDSLALQGTKPGAEVTENDLTTGLLAHNLESGEQTRRGTMEVAIHGRFRRTASAEFGSAWASATEDGRTRLRQALFESTRRGLEEAWRNANGAPGIVAAATIRIEQPEAGVEDPAAPPLVHVEGYVLGLDRGSGQLLSPGRLSPTREARLKAAEAMSAELDARMRDIEQASRDSAQVLPEPAVEPAIEPQAAVPIHTGSELPPDFQDSMAPHRALLGTAATVIDQRSDEYVGRLQGNLERYSDSFVVARLDPRRQNPFAFLASTQALREAAEQAAPLEVAKHREEERLASAQAALAGGEQAAQAEIDAAQAALASIREQRDAVLAPVRPQLEQWWTTEGRRAAARVALERAAVSRGLELRQLSERAVVSDERAPGGPSAAQELSGDAARETQAATAEAIEPASDFQDSLEPHRALLGGAGVLLDEQANQFMVEHLQADTERYPDSFLVERLDPRRQNPLAFLASTQALREAAEQAAPLEVARHRQEERLGQAQAALAGGEQAAQAEIDAAQAALESIREQRDAVLAPVKAQLNQWWRTSGRRAAAHVALERAAVGRGLDPDYLARKALRDRARAPEHETTPARLLQGNRDELGPELTDVLAARADDLVTSLEDPRRTDEWLERRPELLGNPVERLKGEHGLSGEELAAAEDHAAKHVALHAVRLTRRALDGVVADQAAQRAEAKVQREQGLEHSRDGAGKELAQAGAGRGFEP